MKIIKPKEWETVDLLTETYPNKFGEALRSYCFVGNCDDVGCYSTFDLMPQLKKVTSGPIVEEVKEHLWEDCKHFVYHWKVTENDCWIYFDDPEGKPDKMRISEPKELVCAWSWDGDGCLYFRFNKKKVVNTDCKKDYTWEWIK